MSLGQFIADERQDSAERLLIIALGYFVCLKIKKNGGESGFLSSMSKFANIGVKYFILSKVYTD